MPTDETDPRTPPTQDPAAPAASAKAPLPYMRWAKACLGPDDLSLGLSGIPALGAAVRAELGLPVPPEVGEPRAHLKGVVAARHGLAPEQVHPTAGTSHANFVAFFALARGGHIVVEEPAYEAFPRLAQTVGASTASARRDPARGWRFDPASLAAALRPRTALIAISDLHNPSGARLHEDDLDLLLEAAESKGAYLLVDEVYADFDPLGRPSAALRSPRVVVTNSLTKAHGLGDLRAGWILGAPEVVRAIDAWDDLIHPVQPAASLVAAATYLARSQPLIERTRRMAAARAAQVDAWVQATDGVSWTRPAGGITGFLLFEDELDGDVVAARLWEAHGVRAVPGSFFQYRSGLRISYLLTAENLARSLEALGAVLGALR